MELQPELITDRLILRAFTLCDSARVKELAGNKLIADVTANIPHPYPEELAREWIQSHPEKWKNKEQANFAITLRETEEVIGTISLMNLKENANEVGYWVGVDYWNNGYCTEACKKIINFGFVILKLQKIQAHHLTRNPASGKVLINSGFTHVGSSEAVCGFRNISEPTEAYEIINKT